MKRFTLCLLALALFAGALYGDPIHEATGRGNLGRLKFLISKGAKVNVRDKDGRTPIRKAAFRGFIEITVLLGEHGGRL